MEWMNRLRATRGRVGFWAKPLDGEATGFNEDLPLVAASVVKVPVMVEAFRQFRAGRLDPDEQVTIRPEDRMPSCGALTYLSDKVRPTLMDLTTLMIILSDNTAANLMIDRVGVDAVNRTMEERGVPGICLRRKFFQPQLAALGVTNTVTARGCGVLLEKMAKGELLGGEDDARMLSILYNLPARREDRPQDRRGRRHDPRRGADSGEASLRAVHAVQRRGRARIRAADAGHGPGAL